MRREFEGDGTTVIEFERGGLKGRDCIKIEFPVSGHVSLRLPLSEAETLGEALIKCVRAAEADTEEAG